MATRNRSINMSTGAARSGKVTGERRPCLLACSQPGILDSHGWVFTVADCLLSAQFQSCHPRNQSIGLELGSHAPTLLALVEHWTMSSLLATCRPASPSASTQPQGIRGTLLSPSICWTSPMLDQVSVTIYYNMLYHIRHMPCSMLVCFAVLYYAAANMRALFIMFFF